MTFIQRNRRELIWLALNVAAAGFNLWFALWSSLWPMHALFFVVHVVICGYCAKLIFDNARFYAVMVALEGRTADIEALEDDPYLAGEIRRVLNDEVSQ